MIENILKPKTDQEIIQSIAQNPCPVERFALGFCFYFEKNPRAENIPELIENLRNPLLKIIINVSRQVPSLDINPPDFTFSLSNFEHEIFVETEIQHNFSGGLYNYGLTEYKRKMIIVKNNSCYIMP